jgi:hypothetical protein
MIDRRGAVRLAVAGLGVAALSPVARAQQGFQRFVPFLVDLPGWKGGKPEGVATQVLGTDIVTATRTYERGSAKVNASVLMGAPAQAALLAANSGQKAKNSDIRMSTTAVDGMQVHKTYAASQKSGAILVELSGNAVITVAFNGVGEDEAMGLARKFDWKGIQAQAQAK